ncbi:hypothetical protein FACS189483_05290 [Spirochaetia bacterium]|nr:hypothetical protein FACS189483_05290 [Spirochaetia bacterium]
MSKPNKKKNPPGIPVSPLLEGLVYTGYDFDNPSTNMALYFSGDATVKQLILWKHFEKSSCDVNNGKIIKKIESAHVVSEETKQGTNQQENGLSIGTSIVKNSFIVGTNILLSSSSGVGKSLFLIWLTKEANTKGLIKNACFFCLDDKNGKQLPRYTEGLYGLNNAVVTAWEFQDRLDSEMKRLERSASVDAYFLLLNPALRHYLTIKETKMKKMGLLKSPDFVLCVFLQMFLEKIEEGYEFFVLDSSISIFPNVSNLPQKSLDLLLGLPSANRVTFVVLHLRKDNGHIYGTDTIKRPFDMAYLLKSDTPNELESIIYVEADKPNRFIPGDKGFIVRRTKVSDNVAKHEVLADDQVPVVSPSIKLTIPKAILLYCDGIKGTKMTFEPLFSHLKGIGVTEVEESVTNALRRLEKKGIVKNIDGSWKKIGIIRKK